MKKLAFVMIVSMLLLAGCVYQSDLRPKPRETDVWICEEPYMELYWSKENGNSGRIILDEVEQSIFHEADYGATIWVYTPEAKDVKTLEEQKEFCIFKGRADYGKQKFTIEVQEDFKNTFGGELPTLNFKRYNKEEYFKNKE